MCARRRRCCASWQACSACVSTPRTRTTDGLDAVTLSKLAARHEVACGGSDAETTIEALLARRQQAREERDFALADAIRADLAEAGIEVEDTPRGARWSAAR